MNAQRRLWLKQALLLACGSLVNPRPGFAFEAARDAIYGGGRYQDAAGRMLNVLSKVTPGTAAVETLATPFFPHGFSITRGKHAFIFEKIGTGAARVDLTNMTLSDLIAPVGGRMFYGHGAVSTDETLLYSTETSPDEQGAIGVRDAATLAYLGDFPTYGANPHDCQLIDDGNVLLVTNGGGTPQSGLTPSLCYIDVHSQKLLERIEMPDGRFNTGHTLHIRNHQAIVVSAPRKGWGVDRLGAVSLQKDQRMEVLSEPSDVTLNMFGEALSVEVAPEREMFMVTHPTPGMVTFWHLGTRKLLQRLDLPHARGIVLSADRAHAWVSYDAQARLARVSLDTLTLDREATIADTFITGSHLINRPV